MNTEPLRYVAAIDSADGADRRCRLVPAPVLHHRQPDNNLRPVRKSCVFVRYEFFHCNNLRFVLWFYDSGDCSNRRCTKIPCREIFSAGDSCLYGPCVLIWNCFVISAVHCSIIDGYTHEYINQLIHYDSLQQIQSLSSLIAHSQNSKKREDYNTELHPIC